MRCFFKVLCLMILFTNTYLYSQVAYLDIKVTPSTTLSPPQMHVKYNFVGLNVPVVYRTCNYEILPQVVNFYDDSITTIGNYNVYALNALNLRDTVGIGRLNLCHPSNVATANWLRIPMYATITNTLPSTPPNCNGALSFTLDTLGTNVNNLKRYYLKDKFTGDTINMHGRSYNSICSGKYYLDIFQPYICSQCYAYYYRTTYIDGQSYFPHAPLVTPVVTTNGTTGSGCTGSAQIQTSGGMPPYTYDFNLTKNFSSNASKSNLCAGIYIADVADSNGDTTRVQFVINQSYGITNNSNPYSGPIIDTIIANWANCSFNYNQIVDSAFISNQIVVDTNTIILTWNIWQSGVLIQYTDSISYLYQGTNYVSLILFCGNAKTSSGSFRSYRINDYIKVQNNSVGIKNQGMNSIIELYPNPANSNIYIKFNNEQEAEKLVCIYDVYGKVVMTQIIKLNNQVEFNIHDLSSGIYFVKIQSQSGLILNSKFVKD